jgi:hypothetical protein
MELLPFGRNRAEAPENLRDICIEMNGSAAAASLRGDIVDDLVRKTLEIAVSQKGVREAGENRGPQVDAYLRAAGLGPGHPWCAAFVYWAIDTAARELGIVNPFIRTAYCPDIHNWARRHDALEVAPQVGDVFLRYSASSVAGHTGFVTSVDDGRFGTIEGNTNLNGSPEGIGVFKRSRPNGREYRFVRWRRLVAEPDDATMTLVLDNRPLLEMPVRGGRALCPVRKLGEALGLRVDWDQDSQALRVGGKELGTELVLIGNTAYAPVRDLAQATGLQLRVDQMRRRVVLTQ